MVIFYEILYTMSAKSTLGETNHNQEEMMSESKGMGAKIGGALGTVVFVIVMAAVMAYSFSGTVKGMVAVLLWNGSSTLLCGGNQVMKIDGKKVDMTDTVIMAGGSCKLDLTNVEFKSKQAISCGGDAKVTITGGTFEGSDEAISAGGAARVTIKDATIIGGKEGISIGGEADVQVDGGSIRAEKAITAGGNAKIRATGTKIDGAVDKGGNAVVEI